MTRRRKSKKPPLEPTPKIVDLDLVDDWEGDDAVPEREDAEVVSELEPMPEPGDELGLVRDAVGETADLLREEVSEEADESRDWLEDRVTDLVPEDVLAGEIVAKEALEASDVAAELGDEGADWLPHEREQGPAPELEEGVGEEKPWLELEEVALERSPEDEAVVVRAEEPAISQAAPADQPAEAVEEHVAEPALPLAAAAAVAAPATTVRAPRLVGWFIASVLMGAVLGSVITLLILSGINGGLSYTAGVRGAWMMEEQNRLSGELLGLTQDLAATDNQLASLAVLPSQIEIISGDVNTMRKGLTDLGNGLERLTSDLGGVSRGLDGVGGDVTALKGNLGNVTQEVQGLVKQSTDLQAGVTKLGASVSAVEEQVAGFRATKETFDTFIQGLRDLLTAVPPAK